MTEPRRVVLDLDEASNPISGLLATGDGPPLAFTGWLELAALIEAALAPAEKEEAQ